MKRWSVLSLAGLAALLMLGGSEGRSGDKTWKPITVAWHGQSFFIVTTSGGTRIAFDPHVIPEYGRAMGLKADLVLVSHNHNDHNRVEAFENAKDKNLRVILGLKGPGIRADWNAIDEKVGDVRVRSVGVYHDESEGLQRGKNTVFVVEVDGWRIAHLGDLGHELTTAQVRKIGPVDVLMVPVGGIYTLNGSEAKKAVAQLKPREYVFPMHYGTKAFDEVLPLTEFLEDQDRDKVAATDDNKVTLNRDPQRPRPLIVQLHYGPKAAAGKK
jgi:L-ascorbate metabolism protein UlaG (beta-lactamase superfamily)